MDIKQEHIEAINMLQSVYETPRAKAVLDFAVKRGLEKATVTCPDGSEHAATMYAWYLYCNSDDIGASNSKDVETYQVVCIMSAMEESATDPWSYGTKLLYDMRKAGLGPTRKEYALFLAMEDGWDNGQKAAIMEMEPSAVYFYAGKLLTMCNTLPGVRKRFRTEGQPCTFPARKESAIATLQNLAMQYIPACVGQDNATKVAGVLKMLAHRSDFYGAGGPGGYEGGLADHTVDVIYKLVQVAKPITDEEVGLCVLAGLGHDIADAEFFRKDNSGNQTSDILPFGHGRKSVYMLGGYLGDCLPQCVASAIDVHMNDITANPFSALQMMEEPLGLYLHIADVLSIYEVNK